MRSWEVVHMCILVHSAYRIPGDRNGKINLENWKHGEWEEIVLYIIY